MRECQLCGAKSWGPLTARGRALLLNAVRPEDTEVDFTAYRECDNCTMPAQAQIVERPAPDAEFPTIGMKDMPSVMDLVLGPLGGPRPPDPMTVAKEALESMRDRMPQPETRLERIARALLQSPSLVLIAEDEKLTSEAIAAKYVSLAGLIELKMDELK